VDAARVDALRALLTGTGWVERTRDFARSLRGVRSGAAPGGLLLVGTEDEEPWHFAAHLDDEARWSDEPGLAPTLVRWAAPPDAPPHLSVTLARLQEVRRSETLFVVSPGVQAPVPLLERVDDVRRTGATIFALDGGDRDLRGLAHEQLVVPSDDPLLPSAVTLDAVTHLVSSAAGAPLPPNRRGLRDRWARLLDLVAGPAPEA
jgi:hypothetical protein